MEVGKYSYTVSLSSGGKSRKPKGCGVDMVKGLVEVLAEGLAGGLVEVEKQRSRGEAKRCH